MRDPSQAQRQDQMIEHYVVQRASHRCSERPPKPFARVEATLRHRSPTPRRPGRRCPLAPNVRGRQHQINTRLGEEVTFAQESMRENNLRGVGRPMLQGMVEGAPQQTQERARPLALREQRGRPLVSPTLQASQDWELTRRALTRTQGSVHRRQGADREDAHWLVPTHALRPSAEDGALVECLVELVRLHSRSERDPLQRHERIPEDLPRGPEASVPPFILQDQHGHAPLLGDAHHHLPRAQPSRAGVRPKTRLLCLVPTLNEPQ